MKLNTTVQIPDAPFYIEEGASFVSIGSCFAETIAEKLSANHFDVLFNPYGTIYNPVSIANTIMSAVKGIPFDENSLFEYDQIFFPLGHNTTFTQATKEATIEKIETARLLLCDYLEKSAVLIITLGSGWVYELVETSEIVANCHKLPASLFLRRLLSPEEIIQSCRDIEMAVSSINPNMKMIFTISPVRHVRDSLIENSQSKGVLHYALGEYCRENSSVYYFPSYEILMDELRDYRFYDDSLVQPASITKEYIWELFSETLFSARCKQFCKMYSKVKKGLLHKVDEEQDNSIFAGKLLKRVDEMKKQFPHIDFSEETAYFKELL